MIIKILIAVLILLIVSNNISILTDYLKVSGVVPRSMGKYLVATSMAIGLILEGNKMSKFVQEFNLSNEISILTLAILISIFIIGNLIKLPTSATLTTVGVLIGVNIFFGRDLNLSRLYYLGGIWLVSPIISILFAYSLYKLMKEKVYNLNINKAISMTATIFLSYTFGVNTLGLLNSIGVGPDTIQMVLVVISIYVGSIFLSAKVGEEISKTFHSYTVKTHTSISLSTALILEIASNISIPIPLTSLIVLSLIGPIAAKKTRIINMKNFKKVVIFWILTPLISFILSYGFLTMTYYIIFF